MRLIVKEYLSSLREKDELDLLLCDLLYLEGYNLSMRPRSGERQAGVDILAAKDNDLLLIVVKQGDITRAAWDTNQNSVRQSMSEIIDDYIPHRLTNKYSLHNVTIVLVTNGYIHSSVEPSWSGFQVNNHSIGSRKINYDFWSIDDIADLCMKCSFNETLFPNQYQSYLRKILYFMEEPDYRVSDNEKLINEYFKSIESAQSQTMRKKITTSLRMCLALLCNWAETRQLYHIALDILEYSIMKWWQLIKATNKFENAAFLSDLHECLNLYEKYVVLYSEQFSELSKCPHSLPFYNSIEHRLIYFELIGRLCTGGLYLLHKYGPHNQKLNELMNILIGIINHNPFFKYPVFDDNTCEYTLLFLLLLKTERKNDLYELVNGVARGIMMYLINKKLPVSSNFLEDALAIEFTDGSKENLFSEYRASILFGAMLEWLSLYGDAAIYTDLAETLEKHFPQTTCSTWQIRSAEEDFLYSDNTTQYGVSFEILPRRSCAEQLKILQGICDKEDFSLFTYNKYSFPQLAIIASRYYHYPSDPNLWRIQDISETTDTEEN